MAGVLFRSFGFGVLLWRVSASIGILGAHETKGREPPGGARPDERGDGVGGGEDRDSGERRAQVQRHCIHLGSDLKSCHLE